MARRGRFRMSNPGAKELRRKEALKRAEARVGLSDLDKLAALDKNLGTGVGAKRERTKLATRIAAGNKRLAEKPVPKKAVTDGESGASPVSLYVAGHGSVGLQFLNGQVGLIIGSGKVIPIQSISQIRRLADQNEFDAAPFIKAYKAHLVTTEKV